MSPYLFSQVILERGYTCQSKMGKKGSKKECKYVFHLFGLNSLLFLPLKAVDRLEIRKLYNKGDYGVQSFEMTPSHSRTS